MSDSTKRRAICSKILTERPDLVVLTETKMTPNDHKDMIPRTDYHCHFASNGGRSKGVAVLIKNTNDAKITKTSTYDN